MQEHEYRTSETFIELFDFPPPLGWKGTLSGVGHPQAQVS